MSIYTDHTTVDSLIEEYNSLEAFGTVSRNKQCVKLAQIKDVLERDHKVNSKAYNLALCNLLHGIGMKKRIFSADVEVGRWLLQQNDPDAYNEPKTSIYNRLHPPKQKTEKKPAAPKPNPVLDAALKRVEDLQQRVSDYTQILTHFQTGIEKSGMDWLEYLEKRKLPTYSFA